MSEVQSQVSSSNLSRTSSVVRGRLRTVLLTQIIPLFPVLSALEATVVLFEYVSLAIQALQVLAFALVPHYSHGEVLGAVAPVLYFVHLPFWDPKFIELTFYEHEAFFWVACVLVLASPVMLLLAGVSWSQGMETAPTAHSAILILGRTLVHLCGAPLYVPLLQCFLSNMVCGTNGRLAAFPQQECYTGAAIPNFILGVVCFCVLVLIALLKHTCLTITRPLSSFPTAAGNCIPQLLLVFWEAVTCVVFHLMMLHGKANWFALYMFFSSVAAIAMIAFFLPFYAQGVTRRCTGLFAVAALASAVKFFSSSDWRNDAFTAMDIDALIVITCAAPFWWAGQWVASIRQNPELEAALPYLVDRSARCPTADHIIFPRRLPKYDLAFAHHRELCNAVGEEDNHGHPDVAVVLCPFVTTIYVPTDVEVSTRFLLSFFHSSRQMPPVPMTMLATRIYSKGLAKYGADGTVLVALAHMLYSFAGKARLALTQLERVFRSDAPLHVVFWAYRLSIELKKQLNLRDINEQKFRERALIAHKESLMHVAQFWQRLLFYNSNSVQLTTTRLDDGGSVAEAFDLAQFSLIASLMAQKREECYREYHKALANNSKDPALLDRYASFVEDVMLDPESTEEVRRAAQQCAESPPNVRRESMFVTGDVPKQIVDPSAIMRDPHSQTSLRLGVPMLMLAFLVALLVAIIAFGCVSAQQRRSQVDAVDAAAKARSYVAQGGYLSLQYLLGQSNLSSDETSRLRDAIVRVSNDLQAVHSSLTFGRYEPRTARLDDFYRKPLTVRSVVANNSTRTLQSDGDCGCEFATVDFWSLGYDTVEEIHKAVTAPPSVALATAVFAT